MANKGLRESEALKNFELISHDEAFIRKTVGVVIVAIACYLMIYHATLFSKPTYYSLLMAIGINTLLLKIIFFFLINLFIFLGIGTFRTGTKSQ